eukprot:1575520-Ditylum_brightwellii.AAC.1
MEIKTSPAVDGIRSNVTKHSKEMAKQTGTGNKRQAKRSGKLAALNHAKKSRGKLVLVRINAKKDKSSHGNAGTLAINTRGNDKDTKVAQFQTAKEKIMEKGVNFVGAITMQQISVKIEFTAKQAKTSYQSRRNSLRY